MSESFKPYAIQIMHLLMSLLRIENEENGVLCMKIITILHRSFKTALDDQVQPFLDLVVEMYKNMPGVVKETFDTHGSQASTSLANVSTVSSFLFLRKEKS